MLPRQLLVVSNPTDSEMMCSTQIESIVNSLNLAVYGKLLNEWEMLVLPISTELQHTDHHSGIFEDTNLQATGSIFELSEFSNSESTKAIFVDRIAKGIMVLICSEGTVFAPDTVSELLNSLDESRDIFSTESYPVNVGIGIQPLTSVLLASKRANKAFTELVENNSLVLPMSNIISQLSSKYLSSCFSVPTAKSFDTKYSFGKTNSEYV